MYEGLCHFLAATNIGDIEPYRSSEGWNCVDFTPTSSPCNDTGSNWLGIKGCSDVGSPTYISLVNANITGTLPHELRLLKNLTKLELSYNSLHGTLSGDLGQLSQLNFLDVGYNDLSGTVPASFGDLHKLKDFLVDGNIRLNGTIPDSFCALTRLRTVFLLDSNDNTTSFDCYPSCLSDVGNTQFGALPTCATAIVDPTSETYVHYGLTGVEIVLIICIILCTCFLLVIGACIGYDKYVTQPEAEAKAAAQKQSQGENSEEGDILAWCKKPMVPVKFNNKANQQLLNCSNLEAQMAYLQMERDTFCKPSIDADIECQDLYKVKSGCMDKCVGTPSHGVGGLDDLVPYTPTITFATDTTPGSKGSRSIGSTDSAGLATYSVGSAGSSSGGKQQRAVSATRPNKRFSTEYTSVDLDSTVPQLGSLEHTARRFRGDVRFASDIVDPSAESPVMETPVAGGVFPTTKHVQPPPRVIKHPCDTSSENNDHEDDDDYDDDDTTSSSCENMDELCGHNGSGLSHKPSDMASVNSDSSGDYVDTLFENLRHKHDQLQSARPAGTIEPVVRTPAKNKHTRGSHTSAALIHSSGPTAATTAMNTAATAGPSLAARRLQFNSSSPIRASNPAAAAAAIPTTMHTRAHSDIDGLNFHNECKEEEERESDADDKDISHSMSTRRGVNKQSDSGCSSSSVPTNSRGRRAGYVPLPGLYLDDNDFLGGGSGGGIIGSGPDVDTITTAVDGNTNTDVRTNTPSSNKGAISSEDRVLKQVQELRNRIAHRNRSIESHMNDIQGVESLQTQLQQGLLIGSEIGESRPTSMSARAATRFSGHDDRSCDNEEEAAVRKRMPARDPQRPRLLIRSGDRYQPISDGSTATASLASGTAVPCNTPASPAMSGQPKTATESEASSVILDDFQHTQEEW